MKKIDKENRLCGNCDSHNPYKYPTSVFCTTRYIQNEDPIVDTLWHCHQWKPVSQECHCIRDALREKR